MNQNESKRKNQPVRVYIRQRPFNEHELSMGYPNLIQHATGNELVLKSGVIEKRYVFDKVFIEETSQKEIYNAVVSPLINCIISGYNCTVFAYGQTGTGKTYTMVGNHDNEESIGLIPRSASQLFTQLDQITKIEYTVRVSFIEIYNEEVRDLLTNNVVPVKIFDDKGSVVTKGMSEITVLNSQEVTVWLNVGLMERQTASTNMNRNSSRSHSIFILSVLTRHLTEDGDELIKTGKLYLVDLAGSENLGRSGSTELRAREAGNINKSLLTLGKVIKALAHKAQHVPYRDSKLTRILQDSLGGKTKTCMIATISSAGNVWDETLSTLEYAQVARNVSNCPQVNENRKQTHLVKLLKDEIGRLRKELAVARAGEGFYITREHYDKLCANREQLQTEVHDAKKQIAILMERNEELEHENREKNKRLTELQNCYEDAKRELDEKKHTWQQDEHVLNYLKKREYDLRKATDQLWKVCQVSTNHEALFSNKYENQCEISLKNAETARNAYSFFDNSLKLFQNATKDVVERQTISFSEVHANVKCLKENAWKMCRRLSEYSKKIEEDSEKENLKIDDNVLNNEIQRCFDVSLSSAFEGQKKTVEDLEKYNETKIHEMDVLTTRCANAMKQQLNDYMMCVKDIMNSQSSLIQRLKHGIANDEAVLNETIECHRERSHQFIRDFITDTNTKLVSQMKKTKQLSCRYSQEIDNIKSQFNTESERKITNILLGLKSAESNQTTFMSSVRNFSDQTLEKIKKEIDDNVQFVAHTGDTPVRQNYVYPEKLEESLSKCELYQLFLDSQ